MLSHMTIWRFLYGRFDIEGGDWGQACGRRKHSWVQLVVSLLWQDVVVSSLTNFCLPVSGLA